MDKNLVKNEIKKLREEIEYHNKLYYDENRNLISDYEYDKKMSDLINLEIKYPEYKSPSSPTVKVGGKITKEFDTYKHSNQMLSLSNTYTNQDLEEYDKRIKKNLNIKNVEYSCELKYDGVALSILYENGKFKRALTRGDGSYGDDVSNNAITGLYFFDKYVCEYTKKLKPSKRGELEITDLINEYKKNCCFYTLSGVCK